MGLRWTGEPLGKDPPCQQSAAQHSADCGQSIKRNFIYCRQMPGMMRLGLRPTIAISLALLLLVGRGASLVMFSDRRESARATFSVDVSVPCTAILANGTVNATVSGVYASILNSTGGGLAGPSILSLPAQSVVDNATIAMFSSVCPNPLFQSLVQTWGASNFSLEYYSGNDTTSLEAANYTVTWAVPNGTTWWGYEEWWSGNLSSSTLSGPFSSNSAATPVSAGLPSTSISKDWAGFNWSVPKLGGSPDTLVSESAYTRVQTITNPACCQHNVGSHTIDPVAATWTGMEGSTTSDQGGSVQLLQTGFVYDTVNSNKNFCAIGAKRSCHYGLWWEDLTLATTALTKPRSVAYMYSGSSHARLGDVLEESVFTNTTAPPGNFTTVIVDVTLNHTWSHAVSIPTWTPTTAQYITEAPDLSVNNTGFHIQQIANFNQTYFEYGIVCGKTRGCVHTPTTSYSTFTLEQLVGNYNTAETPLSTCPNILGSKTTNCQTVQWLNSNYDYTFV